MAAILSLPQCDKRGTRTHYNDVIMTTIASQITSLTVVYSIVYSGADQRQHESSASLAFVWGIHRDRWFPAQRTSNAENVSIWWRHQDWHLSRHCHAITCEHRIDIPTSVSNTVRCLYNAVSFLNPHNRYPIEGELRVYFMSLNSGIYSASVAVVLRAILDRVKRTPDCIAKAQCAIDYVQEYKVRVCSESKPSNHHSLDPPMCFIKWCICGVCLCV